jgi:hypothetical protein
VLDLGLVAAAAADHGLFHFGCRVFVHHDPLTDHCANGGAARLPQLQRRIGVARHEYTLDPALDRLVRGDNVTQLIKDAFEPQRKGGLTDDDQRAMENVDQLAAVININDAHAGALAAWIDTDDARHDCGEAKAGGLRLIQRPRSAAKRCAKPR